MPPACTAWPGERAMPDEEAMTTEETWSFRQRTPVRSREATARLAWLVLSIACAGSFLLCALIGYGVWRFWADAMAPQGGNTLEAFAGPVSLIRAGEAQLITVPLGQPVPLHEGETVQVESSAPPGAAALVTLWDGSTLQLYPGARLTFTRLRATRYTSRRQDVQVAVPAGVLVVGVSPLRLYNEVSFSLDLGGSLVQLEPGGSYLVRWDAAPEVAVRAGSAWVTRSASGERLPLAAGEKVVLYAGRAPNIEPARWELLRNGDFAQDLDGWVFRYDQAWDGGTVNAALGREKQRIGVQDVWAARIWRIGGTRDVCAGILSQEIRQDVSPYRALRLEFDLRINYQSLPGGGPLGTDYPFAVRIRYRDGEGRSRQYTYGFYYRTEPGYRTEMAEGEAIPFPHYRWQHVNLDLTRLRPAPVYLIGLDLFASGHDFNSFVANVSLQAE
ncbi:MAG: hypothetical protein ACP5SI_12350 [Chloroflexia bacterium]